MLLGQEIGLLASLQISVIGMLVVMLELFLLYLFVRCLSLLLLYMEGKKPETVTEMVHNEEVSRPEDEITDMELCCVMGAVAEESGLSPEQLSFTRIQRIK